MAAPVVAGVSATTAGTSTCNVVPPIGIQPGDLLLLLGANLSSTNLTCSETGFAILASEVSQATAIRCWWKEADGTEDASWTITGNAINNLGGLAMRITGWKGDAPFIGDVDTGRLASGAALPDVELVDQEADSLGIHLVSFGSSRVFTPETGWTPDTDGSNARLGVAHAELPSGDSGVVNGSMNSGTTSVAMLFAVRPALILPSSGFLGLL